MTELPLRPLRIDDPDDVARWATLISHVFQFLRPDAAELAWRRERSLGQRVSVVEDAGDLVAAFRSYDTTLSVPGGALVPADAVSGVVVQPTHKRRGLLTRWLSDDLRDAHRRGDVAAVLFASEAGIYGRYGFGVATAVGRWRIDVPRARFRRPPTGQVRIVEADEARVSVEALYEAAQRRSAGSIGRSPASWRTSLGVTDLVPDSRKRWYALHLADGSRVPDGLLSYTLHDDWRGPRPRSRLDVQDLVAQTDAAEDALLQYACHVDFLATVSVDRAPGWELPHLLTDPRAARVDRLADGLWVRILDVPAALESRGYRIDGSVVIQVDDPLGLCSGRWRLQVEAGIARCRATTDEPDLTLGVAALGCLWLGGDVAVPSIAALVRTGAARAASDDVARVSALFGCPAAPFSLTHF